jgi:hypothetical protein
MNGQILFAEEVGEGREKVVKVKMNQELTIE